MPLFLVAALLAALEAGAPPHAVPLVISCTPVTICVDGGQRKKSEHPIVDALERAGAGTRITLAPGEYAPFTIGFDRQSWNNARTSGGKRGLPIVIEGYGLARIRSGSGDSIGIDQTIPNGHITFKGIKINTGARAGIMFYKQPRGRVHAGYTFEDCDILGGFNHVSGRGRNSKWGVWAHQLQDFRFAGTLRPARVQGIRREHGFYIQNPSGKIVIENVEAGGLGRTFCQFTARASDGPASSASIAVRDCTVRNVGVAKGDGYKGGSAFTIAGRLGGDILFENNTYHAGFNKTWLALTTGDKPYGTGAFVAWQGKEAASNGSLTLVGNDFRFAPGCGDRPVVAIGGCRSVSIRKGNHFESGGEQPALALDPVDLAGRRVSPPNGSVKVSSGSRFVGPVLLGATELNEEELLARFRGR